MFVGRLHGDSHSASGFSEGPVWGVQVFAVNVCHAVRSEACMGQEVVVGTQQLPLLQAVVHSGSWPLIINAAGSGGVHRCLVCNDTLT